MHCRSVCIALFVKPPVPGKVKTRLARDIGNDTACEIYSALVARIIVNATETGITLVICHDGTDVTTLPATWCNAATLCIPQQGNDLGERMKQAFITLFADGFEKVILIGSDIPGLDTHYLAAASEQLQQHDLVVGPALDGGYCLIGCRKESFCSALFDAIPWSTDQVLALTLTAAGAAGLSVGLLPPLQDIDTLDDLKTCCNSGQFPHLHHDLIEQF